MEYALILFLVAAVVIVVILTALAPRVSELFQAAIEAISGAPRYLQIGLIAVLLIPLLVWLVRLAPQLPKVLGTDVRQSTRKHWADSAKNLHPAGGTG